MGLSKLLTFACCLYFEKEGKGEEGKAHHLGKGKRKEGKGNPLEEGKGRREK